MSLRLWVLATLLCIVGGANSAALDMNVRTDDKEKLAFVNLWGKIEPGDDQKFRDLITPWLRSGYLIFKVNVFSGGGDVKAAMGIADQIKTLQTRTAAPTRFWDIVGNRRVQRSYPSCWFTENHNIPRPVEGVDW